MTKTGAQKRRQEERNSQGEYIGYVPSESLASLSPSITEDSTHQVSSTEPAADVSHAEAVRTALSDIKRGYNMDQARENLLDTTLLAGSEVASRGEEIAGITTDEVRSRWESRLQVVDDQISTVAEEHPYNLDADPRLTDEDRSWIRRWTSHAGVTETSQVTDFNGDRYGIAPSEAAVWQLRLGAPATSPEGRELALLAQGQRVQIAAGVDEQTQGDLHRLAEGYKAALSEQRATGGKQRLHHRSHPKAVKAFDAAADLYPSDWIQASNARIEAAAGPEAVAVPYQPHQHPPIARWYEKRRAHYSDYQVHTFRSRVHASHIFEGDPGHSVSTDAAGVVRSNNARLEIHQLPTDQKITAEDYPYVYPALIEDHNHRIDVDGAARPRYAELHYEVEEIEGRYHWEGHIDEQTPPPGNGWQPWQHPSDAQIKAWRRPKTRMEEVDQAAAPEISANPSRGYAAAETEGYPAAAHELAHRFEFSVPGIIEAERSFFSRRATAAGGELKTIEGTDGEVYAEGGWVNSYMGRVYDETYEGTQPYEIMSTGVEGCFAGRYGGLIGAGEDLRSDTQHRDFVLGVMATVGR